MFAVGHLSIGYLSTKVSAKLLKQEINLPLIFLLSLIPDIDILIPSIVHRTITHSIIISIIAFLPIFAVYRTKSIPYFIALAQHSLIGDFITGGKSGEGAQLLWPITSTSYGLPISILSTTNILLELSSFLVAIGIMLKTKDLQKLVKGNRSNLCISIPILTVILPSFIQFPLSVPHELLIPHLIYLILFLLAIANAFKKHSDEPSAPSSPLEAPMSEASPIGEKP